MTPAGRLTSPDAIRAFAFAGHAVLTLVSRRTGARFTYRIARAERGDGLRPWFVSVKTGPEYGDDQFLGSIFPSEDGEDERLAYRHGRRSRIGEDAPSARAFAWWLRHLDTDLVEVWHEGRCGRCGRPLTVPESIATGLGPVCAGMEGGS